MLNDASVRDLAPKIVLQRLDQLQLVTEWCPHTLWTARPRSSDDLSKVCGQMCSALRFLHEKGIAHVDVSPYNILVREKGAAYVLNDMGLSVKLEASHVKFAVISAQSN